MQAEMTYSWKLLLLLVMAMVLPSRGGEPPAGTEIAHPVDGAIMVYVPSGPFIMGLSRPRADALAKQLGYKDYHAIAAEEWFPQRQETVSGYFVDKYEVTNARWHRYVAATGYRPAEGQPRKAPAGNEPDAYAAYPVVRVTWAEAQQYANWARKRLPTEKQWEKAARGTDGRLYPWGDEPLSPERGVFVDLKTRQPTQYRMVGSRPDGASPYGCLDMAGNVYEWTCEWMEPYPNNPEAGRMLSYTGHQFGCLRGGSFYHGPHSYACAKRFGFKPDETYYHVGFRCVWEPPAGYFEGPAFAAAKAEAATRQAELDAMKSKAAAPPPRSF
jgi:formylglycine-generating enzyme required for sulfatase activity